MYLLLSSVHCPNGEHILDFLSLYKVISVLLRVIHYVIGVWFLLGQWNSCITLNAILVSAADFWRWVPWLSDILLINKMPLHTQHQFMALRSEVMKSSFRASYIMRQVSWVRCVDTSVPRWEMWIWLADMNFHALRIQDYICTHF